MIGLFTALTDFIFLSKVNRKNINLNTNTTIKLNLTIIILSKAIDPESLIVLEFDFNIWPLLFEIILVVFLGNTNLPLSELAVFKHLF